MAVQWECVLLQSCVTVMVIVNGKGISFGRLTASLPLGSQSTTPAAEQRVCSVPRAFILVVLPSLLLFIARLLPVRKTGARVSGIVSDC